MNQSANYVRTELPVRIAHRLRDLQSLPYVVVTQEGVAKVREILHLLDIILTLLC
jgi:pyruvate dehydrogenase kinase 2/3/4